MGKAILQLARGASLEQRLEPVKQVFQRAAQKTASVDNQRLALGVLGLAGVALGVFVTRRKPRG
jgi:hypothetical protein